MPILLITICLILFSLPCVFATGHESHHVSWAHYFYKKSGLNDLIAGFRLKLNNLQYLDAKLEQLLTQVAELETKNAELNYELQAGCHEKQRAEVLKHQAEHEGGVQTARTIASLQPAEPDLLSKPPKFVFESALKAFEREDFETAAKGFVTLVENPENNAFQTAQVFYLSGVSLYHLGNYKNALQYFNQAIHFANQHDGGVNDISFAPRAMGWIALCYQNLGNTPEVKQVIKNLIQKFPKSKEAQRLNRHG